MGLILSLRVLGYGQLSADCINATPVCTTFYSVPVINYPPNNVQAEIPPTSCLSGGESNGVWYTFTVQTPGILSYNIIPFDNTDDYDWALYDLANASCADIPTGIAPEVSCNYSNSITNGGITGANGGPNNQDEPTLNVVAGQTFVLYISNFSGSTSGYRLDFANSTATIPDNSIPTLVSAVPSDSCGATSVIITFSENVACNSVNPADFILVGPSGPIAVTSVSGCGAQYSQTFNLNISPSMTESGVYTLTLDGFINDICGNVLAGPIVFNINNNALDVTVNVVNATCGNDDGSATAVVNGGHAPFNFAWSNGFVGNPVDSLPRGPHSVTVVDALGCIITIPFLVSDPTSFTFSVSTIPDTCSKGNGVLDVNVVGFTGPYIYDFDGDQTGPSDIYSNAIGDSNYVVTVTDVLGCWWADTVSVMNILNDSLEAFYSVSDQEIDFLFPYATFYNQSLYEDNIQWLINGQTYLGNSYQYEFPTYGAFPVSIVAFDQNGCRDTFTMTITVKVILSIFIPNAITVNDDGLNEIFYVKGIGMDTTTFQLSIFDGFGREIYSSNDINQGWDGRTQQGTNTNPQDVYAYRLTVRDIYGDPYVRTGRITVIR
jgi:gliding motility-associated-like protein